MKIRQATKKDITAVAEIHRHSKVFMNQQFKGDHLDNHPLNQYEQNWKEYIDVYSDLEVIVIEDKGVVKGVASFGPHALREDGVALLDSLYVAVDKIGYGYGNRLHKEVEEKVSQNGFDVLSLVTPEGNDIGIQFYENRNYYPSGENYTVNGQKFVGYEKKLT